LQLKGNLDFDNELFIIPASLSSTNLKKSVPIEFIVDTGASRTIINDKDVRRLQINYDDLESSRDEYFGVGGTDLTSYEILDCRLLFTDDDENTRFEDLEYVVVNQHHFKSEDEEKKMMSLYSLLGLDVLKKYNIRFSNYTVFLED